MGLVLAVLLLALLLGGIGFAVHALWWIAVIVLVLWIIGSSPEGAKPAGTAGNAPLSTLTPPSGSLTAASVS